MRQDVSPLDFADFETTLRRTHEALQAARDALDARSQLNAIQRELEIAARIQASILPREFCPERDDFLIYAEMTPARVVGGDFYDFFLIDEERLGFVIGDVSGKGIPAAIFMAVSRTLLRATAVQGASAGDCVQYVNKVLSTQSNGAMFVTIFYGILHTRTGEIEFCIGGHNPPYIFSQDQVRAVKASGGMIVGILDQAQYQTERMRLAPGEGDDLDQAQAIADGFGYEVAYGRASEARW